jgi:hypothetical protein
VPTVANVLNCTFNDVALGTMPQGRDRSSAFVRRYAADNTDDVFAASTFVSLSYPTTLIAEVLVT